MAKKSSKKKRQGKMPEPMEIVDPIIELPADVRAKAVLRLKQLFTELSKSPETVLETLDRLKIPYQVQESSSGWIELSALDKDNNCEWVCICKRDLEEGEKLNTSMLNRIYSDEVALPKVPDLTSEQAQQLSVLLNKVRMRASDVEATMESEGK